MANTNCLPRGPVRENKIILNYMQCLFVDDSREVPDERLLCYPTRNVFVPFCDTVCQTNALYFARINVVSARIGGSTAP